MKCMKNPLLFLLNSSRYCAKIIEYLIGQIEYSDLIDSRSMTGIACCSIVIPQHGR